MKIIKNDNNEAVQISDLNKEELSDLLVECLKEMYQKLRDDGFYCHIDATVDLDQGSYPSIIFYERPECSGKGYYNTYRVD